MSVFYQAWASDSINEIHPEKLSGFLPTQTFKKFKKEEKVRSTSLRITGDGKFDELSFLRFKESEYEKAIISVSDLKKQFERNSKQDKKKEKNNHLKSPRAKTPNGTSKVKTVSKHKRNHSGGDWDGESVDGFSTGSGSGPGTGTGTRVNAVVRPQSPMSANIAALSRRFSNCCSTLTLPGQESSSGKSRLRLRCGVYTNYPFTAVDSFNLSSFLTLYTPTRTYINLSPCAIADHSSFHPIFLHSSSLLERKSRRTRIVTPSIRREMSATSMLVNEELGEQTGTRT